MSYSFSARAASKALVLVAVAEKFAEVVAQQPVHAIDEPQVKAAAESVVGLLVDDSERDVLVSMSGYLSTVGTSVTGASVSVNASVIDRVSAEG